MTTTTTLRMPATNAGVATRPAGRRDESTLSAAGLVVLLAGALLAITDFFIVNVALPDIQTTLDGSDATLELVVTGYGIAYALLLVVGGRWGDAHGRKRLFTAGIAAFTVMSLACGLAPTIDTLIAARIAQGMAAAMMVPQVMATIQATTVGQQRAKALGWFGATAGAAAVIGQVLGGFLVSADIAGSSWRPIFLVNVPIGLVAIVAARRYVPDTRSPAPAAADFIGAAILGVLVLSLLVPLMEGRTLGWPTWTIGLLAVSPLALAAFVLVERRLERQGSVPLVPPSLVRIPSMARGLGLAVPFFAGFGGFMFVYAVAVQYGLGHSAFVAGITIAPMAITFLAASMLTAQLIARYGRRVLGVGALMQASGLLVTAELLVRTWPDVSLVELGAVLAFVGFGQGLVLSPLFGVILSRVPLNEAGIASGVLVTTQQISLALGVATLGNLFLSTSTGHGISMGAAWAIVLGIQAAVGIAFAALSQALPEGQRV